MQHWTCADMMTRASFCSSKILKNLHLFLQKVACIFKESCSQKLGLGLCTTRLRITSNRGSDNGTRTSRIVAELH